MKLRTELIAEIRTLAVTFTAGDALRDWIEEVSDQDIQEVLGSRVRTIASAMSRLEVFMKDYGYDDARADEYEAQAILNEADEDGPADTSGAKTSAEIAFEDFDSETFNDGDADEEDEEDGVDPKRMAEKLKRARARYEPTVAYTGRLSSNTGDDLSLFLAGMTPNQVCILADWAVLGMPSTALFHWAKYSHLNPGSIRMNAGNRIRSRVKSGDITMAALQAHLASSAL
tara:strand:- start:3961 stop:4647 length:687 start_codon:yes stop_codon:yes gene_type:complete